MFTHVFFSLIYFFSEFISAVDPHAPVQQHLTCEAACVNTPSFLLLTLHRGTNKGSYLILSYLIL